MAGQVYVEAIESLKKTAASFVEENISQCMNVLVSSTVSPPVCNVNDNNRAFKKRSLSVQAGNK